MNLVFSILMGVAMLCVAVGFFLAAFVAVRASHRTPGYWEAQFGSLAERFAKRSEAGVRARREENETTIGRVANRLLQAGTALGVLLAIAFGLLRLSGVPIHGL
ncbi:hypothetical protein MCELHM10_01803 [Paracoccaceae bacterium]|jgi:hypothetical protein